LLNRIGRIWHQTKREAARNAATSGIERRRLYQVGIAGGQGPKGKAVLRFFFPRRTARHWGDDSEEPDNAASDDESEADEFDKMSVHELEKLYDALPPETRKTAEQAEKRGSGKLRRGTAEMPASL